MKKVVTLLVVMVILIATVTAIATVHNNSFETENEPEESLYLHFMLRHVYDIGDSYENTDYVDYEFDIMELDGKYNTHVKVFDWWGHQFISEWDYEDIAEDIGVDPECYHVTLQNFSAVMLEIDPEHWRDWGMEDIYGICTWKGSAE